MRLLVHRGQVLLLLVVGLLAGVAVAGVCLELNGATMLGPLRASEVFTPPRTQLPSQIVIGGVKPSNDGGLAGSGAAHAAPAVTQPATPTAASPTAGVVPGNVYTYPPDDHGRSGPGGGDRSGHGG